MFDLTFFKYLHNFFASFDNNYHSFYFNNPHEDYILRKKSFTEKEMVLNNRIDKNDYLLTSYFGTYFLYFYGIEALKTKLSSMKYRIKMGFENNLFTF
jgi:hypothetical protein